MSNSTGGSQPNLAVATAREREDVAVGDEIVRHRRSSRLLHWTVALLFFVCLFSGMPIWSPIFGWMAGFFGGLAVCRWLHPWSGIALAVVTLGMFVQWRRDMVLEKSERGWLGPKLLRYLAYRDEDPDVGKYNGGQKLLFWSACLATLVLLGTGIVLWWPEKFSLRVREVSILLHDAVFVLFVVAIVFHAYLGTAAEPGTFRAMTRGTVSRAWARLHHPRWYREVTREESRPK